MHQLTVVIGTYNRRTVLDATLRALGGAIAVPHRIIVIDAGSTDGTWELLASFPDVHRIQDGARIGQATSYNRVFRTLDSDYTCWLSDDNVVVPGMLDLAARLLRRHPRWGMVALKTKDVTGPSSDLPFIGGIWPSGVLNCNQGVIRTDLLKRLGGFDESFRDYGIDADLTTRVLLGGDAVAMTQAVAIHHHRDHDSESWTDPAGRQHRLQRALALYEKKFADLIEQAQPLRAARSADAASGSLAGIRRVWERASRLPLVAARVPGYGERDWGIIARCPFIPRWDLVRNCQRSYYLVQRLPDRCRSR